MTCSLDPGGHPAAAHVHPNQEERFGVLAGSIKLRVDGEETTLGVGEWAEVPVGPAAHVVER